MITEDIKNALLPLSCAQIRKLTISNPKNALFQYLRITAKDSENGFLVEKFTQKQAFHETVAKESIISYLETELAENFRQLNVSCVGFDFELKISKKGKILTNKSNNSITVSDAASTSHNRKKNYILEEGIFVPALYELGIMTKEGKIVAQKYDKFKQINRFVECIDDALKNDSETETLEIVDFGCGKSYLTFVLYYYMTQIKKRNVHITGLDLKKDVIEKCTSIAKQYGYSDMTFLCGDIKDYNPKRPPDMVVTLHACDTATDFALFNAINWNSRYIFSVPCCQHELNTNIKQKAFGIMTDYGLIKERLCALATDAQRAKLLELCGYKTDILEFIDMDNSPKNLLIRAKKTRMPNEFKRKAILSELDSFINESGVELTLYTLVKNRI